MSDAFERLDRELVAAAARLATVPAMPPPPSPPVTRRGPRTVTRRAAALAVVLLALAAGGAWLATGREATRPGSQRAAPAWRLDVGESRIASVRAPARGAQPQWAVRVSRQTPTVVCVTLGQVRTRTLGLTGPDGRFRALPADTPDACGAGAALAARPAQRGGTVVGGFAGDDLRSVRIDAGGAPETVPHGPEGAFVYVTRSTRATPVVSLRWGDGRAERLVVPPADPVIPPAVLPSPRPAVPSPAPVVPAPSERRDGPTQAPAEAPRSSTPPGR